ncbi:hypothetical protein GWI33_021575 [Rhynchophorus ferrugineus]|uniref:Uncharacterized protein n=1 Tax=Rhynchophorus ferrugineus TaxID=354439 RepID=A0A834MID1_RHYFE|nr:hypothetical protein GWI33_021575 [Rhynchophorus ferrugineus]
MNEISLPHRNDILKMKSYHQSSLTLEILLLRPLISSIINYPVASPSPHIICLRTSTLRDLIKPGSAAAAGSGAAEVKAVVPSPRRPPEGRGIDWWADPSSSRHCQGPRVMERSFACYPTGIVFELTVGKPYMLILSVVLFIIIDMCDM